VLLLSSSLPVLISQVNQQTPLRVLLQTTTRDPPPLTAHIYICVPAHCTVTTTCHIICLSTGIHTDARSRTLAQAWTNEELHPPTECIQHKSIVGVIPLFCDTTPRQQGSPLLKIAHSELADCCRLLQILTKLKVVRPSPDCFAAAAAVGEPGATVTCHALSLLVQETSLCPFRFSRRVSFRSNCRKSRKYIRRGDWVACKMVVSTTMPVLLREVVEKRLAVLEYLLKVYVLIEYGCICIQY
jgi:hypothetical protein